MMSSNKNIRLLFIIFPVACLAGFIFEVAAINYFIYFVITLTGVLSVHLNKTKASPVMNEDVFSGADVVPVMNSLSAQLQNSVHELLEDTRSSISQQRTVESDAIQRKPFKIAELRDAVTASEPGRAGAMDLAEK